MTVDGIYLATITKRDSLLPLSIDRIQRNHYSEGYFKFMENEKFDFSEYFEDFIGIQKGGKVGPEKIMNFASVLLWRLM